MYTAATTDCCYHWHLPTALIPKMGCGHQMHTTATTSVCPLFSFILHSISLHPFRYHIMLHSTDTLCSIPLLHYIPFRILHYVPFRYKVMFHSAIMLCSIPLLRYVPFVTIHSAITLQSIPLLCYVPFRYYVVLNANYSQTAKRNSN